MKKKMLALAVAGALVSPQVLAAQGEDGLSYTSAAEGIGGNVEIHFKSLGSGKKGDKAEIHYRGDFDVQGEVDLGNGLTGYYDLDIRNNADTNVDTDAKLGMRGAFGDISFGKTSKARAYVTGLTDLANWGSCNYCGTFGDSKNAVLYQTPEMNGFQAAIQVNAKNTAAAGAAAGFTYNKAVTADDEKFVSERSVGTDTNNNGAGTTSALGVKDAKFQAPEIAAHSLSPKAAGAATKDKTAMDYWAVAAKYSMAGFTGAFTYSVHKKGLAAYSNQWTMTKKIADADGGNALTAREDIWVDEDDDNSVDNGEVFTKEEVGYQSTGSKKVADKTVWGGGLSYAQDNWQVAGYYGVATNQSAPIVTQYDSNDAPGGGTIGDADDVPGSILMGNENSKIMSLGGKVSVDRIGIYGIWEQVTDADGYKGRKHKAHTFGAEYHLSSQAKAWLEYVTSTKSEEKNSKTKQTGYVIAGVKYSF